MSERAKSKIDPRISVAQESVLEPYSRGVAYAAIAKDKGIHAEQVVELVASGISALGLLVGDKKGLRAIFDKARTDSSLKRSDQDQALARAVIDKNLDEQESRAIRLLAMDINLGLIENTVGKDNLDSALKKLGTDMDGFFREYASQHLKAYRKRMGIEEPVVAQAPVPPEPVAPPPAPVVEEVDTLEEPAPMAKPEGSPLVTDQHLLATLLVAGASRAEMIVKTGAANEHALNKRITRLFNRLNIPVGNVEALSAFMSAAPATPPAAKAEPEKPAKQTFKILRPLTAGERKALNVLLVIDDAGTLPSGDQNPELKQLRKRMNAGLKALSLPTATQVEKWSLRDALAAYDALPLVVKESAKDKAPKPPAPDEDASAPLIIPTQIAPITSSQKSVVEKFAAGMTLDVISDQEKISLDAAKKRLTNGLYNLGFTRSMNVKKALVAEALKTAEIAEGVVLTLPVEVVESLKWLSKGYTEPEIAKMTGTTASIAGIRIRRGLRVLDASLDDPEDLQQKLDSVSITYPPVPEPVADVPDDDEIDDTPPETEAQILARREITMTMAAYHRLDPNVRAVVKIIAEGNRGVDLERKAGIRLSRVDDYEQLEAIISAAKEAFTPDKLAIIAVQLSLLEQKLRKPGQGGYLPPSPSR